MRGVMGIWNKLGVIYEDVGGRLWIIGYDSTRSSTGALTSGTSLLQIPIKLSISIKMMDFRRVTTLGYRL